MKNQERNVKIVLILILKDMLRDRQLDGNGSGSSQMAAFIISGVESSGPTTRELYHAQSRQSVAA